MADNYDFDEDFMDVEVDEKRGKTSDRLRKAEKKKKRKKGKTAVGLVVAVLVVIAGVVGVKYFTNNGGTLPFMNQTKETQAAEETETAEEETEAVYTLELDPDTELVNLVKNYYAARVSGDGDTLATILAEGSTLNTDELESEKQFIEDYTDIATYVTDGLNENEKVVYVSYSIKFKDIDTPAPGLEPVYMTVDENGNKRLTFYNDFNSDLKAYMNTVSSSADVVELSTKVREAYQNAQDSDEKLKAFLTALAGESEAETEVEETSAAEETTAAESEAAAETTAAETTASGDEITFEDVDDMQYTTAKVKCRKSPVLDDDTNDFVEVEAGTRVHVIGISEKWSKVTLSSEYTGYIYNDYLTPYGPEEN